MAEAPARISELPAKWETGNEEALRRLFPLIYDDLRHLASHYLRNERPGHTPRWGNHPFGKIKPFGVELWLKEFDVAPKTKRHLHIGVLVNCAMRF